MGQKVWFHVKNQQKKYNGYLEFCNLHALQKWPFLAQKSLKIGKITKYMLYEKLPPGGIINK